MFASQRLLLIKANPTKTFNNWTSNITRITQSTNRSSFASTVGSKSLSSSTYSPSRVFQDDRRFFTTWELKSKRITSLHGQTTSWTFQRSFSEQSKPENQNKDVSEHNANEQSQQVQDSKGEGINKPTEDQSTNDSIKSSQDQGSTPPPTEEIKSTNEEQQSSLEVQEKTEESKQDQPKTMQDKITSYVKNNFWTFVIPGILLGILSFLWYTNQSRSREFECRKKSLENYILNREEIEALREKNNFLTIKNLYELKRFILKNQNGTIDSINLTVSDIEELIKNCLNQQIRGLYLLERLVDQIQGKQSTKSLSMKDWMFVLCMISEDSHEDRMVFNFSLLDTDDDGHISKKEVQEFLNVILKLGWCYSPLLFKQTRKYPMPEYKVLTADEFVSDFIERELDDETKISWDNFLDLPFRLI